MSWLHSFTHSQVHHLLSTGFTLRLSRLERNKKLYKAHIWYYVSASSQRSDREQIRFDLFVLFIYGSLRCAASGIKVHACLVCQRHELITLITLPVKQLQACTRNATFKAKNKSTNIEINKIIQSTNFFFTLFLRHFEIQTMFLSRHSHRNPLGQACVARSIT